MVFSLSVKKKDNRLQNYVYDMYYHFLAISSYTRVSNIRVGVAMGRKKTLDLD